MAVTLQLGDFTFSEYEIPERITMVTAIRAVVRKMVGGARNVNMMGYDPQPLEWSGMLLGENALQRARTLKQMALAQKMLSLTFSEYSYSVVICEFVEDFQREYEIYYRIRLEVVADNAAQKSSSSSGIDAQIGADMSTANSLADSIGDSGLSSAVGVLNSAVSTVSSFAKAAQSTLQTVLAPLATAQAQVKTLIASTENTLQSVSTVGGLLPNNPIAQQVSKLSSQVNAMTQQPQLLQLQGVLSRMGGNIGQIGSASKAISTIGGNLYDMGAKLYGNAEAGFNALTRANPSLGGDPFIPSTQKDVDPSSSTPTAPVVTEVAAPPSPPPQDLAAQRDEANQNGDWYLNQTPTGAQYYAKGISFD
jgi:hypothetical protein